MYARGIKTMFFASAYVSYFLYCSMLSKKSKHFFIYLHRQNRFACAEGYQPRNRNFSP